jgi:hypothetical protein
MDFDPYRSHWKEDVPPLTLLEPSWEMTSPRGRVLTCGVFQTIVGLEVRCGYAEDDLIRSQSLRLQGVCTKPYAFSMAVL